MQISNDEVLKIYINLIKVSGQEDIAPQIQIAEKDIVNAYTTKDGIVLFRGVIDALQNKHQLALVIAHELSHYLLGHCFVDTATPKGKTRIQELQADKYGGILMMLAGYNLDTGRDMLLILKNLFGDVMDADHPDNAFRYAQLNIDHEAI